eukprot:scaffold7052_cov254-Pinguiococcus_pyrenoidosus.AAC.50
MERFGHVPPMLGGEDAATLLDESLGHRLCIRLAPLLHKILHRLDGNLSEEVLGEQLQQAGGDGSLQEARAEAVAPLVKPSAA